MVILASEPDTMLNGSKLEFGEGSFFGVNNKGPDYFANGLEDLDRFLGFT